MKRWSGIFIVTASVIVLAVSFQNLRFQQWVEAQSTTVTVGGLGLSVSPSGGLSGNGSGFTLLNASNLASGTVPDVRLSSNVPLLNGVNTFTQSNTWQLPSGSLGYFKTATATSHTIFYGYDGTNTAEISLDAESGTIGSNSVLTGILGVSNKITNGVGLQIVTGSGCTITAGAIGNNCTATLTLPVTEPDTAYDITGCGITGAANGSVTLGGAANTSTTTISITEIALSNTNVGGGTIKCIVTHN